MRVIGGKFKGKKLIEPKDKIYANGGRVLNFTSLSDDFLKARNEVHQSIKKLNWNGGFYRKDIGFKVID